MSSKKIESVHNFFSNSKETGSAVAGWKRKTKGYYVVEFIENIRKATDKDISFRINYAKEYLSSYLRVPVQVLKLNLKQDKQTLTTLDEVYYVVAGQFVVGKMSIRTQRAFNRNTLTFIYQSKNLGNKKHVNKGRQFEQTANYNRMKERKHLHTTKKRGS